MVSIFYLLYVNVRGRDKNPQKGRRNFYEIDNNSNNSNNFNEQ